MKKIILIILLLLNCIFFTACATMVPDSSANSSANSSSTQSSKPNSSSSSSSQKEEPVHEHDLIFMIANDSTCTTQGNIEHYYCWRCKKYFLDENAENEIDQSQTKAPLASHTLTFIAEVPATCGETGVIEHYLCEVCNNAYEDENGSKYLSSLDLVIPTLEHVNLEHRDAYPVNGDENGRIEHWYCEDCNGYFLDAYAKEGVDEVDTILYSAINIPDFIVTVPEGREPVILQLTDTQIIDGAQTRPDRSPNDKNTYATWKIPQYCNYYVKETIEATNPDLIIITGDLVYGKYDDNGSALQAFIEFMEGFKIPWAPVFGNHEAESEMGADWQCEQLENAEYCLFKQNTISGNGNYSVGIVQGGELKRVFYMLDSNGCNEASAKSISNGQTSTKVGFKRDQIDWYTNQIKRLKELSPNTKYSFAFHIQLAVFAEAFAKYGFDNEVSDGQDIFIDYLPNREEGDFGYLDRKMKNGWDTTKEVYNGLKELGVDSIFVGHEHCNSASVVYEGIRFQYGQKSSEYDRYNGIDPNTGKITPVYLYNRKGTALVGGTVMTLSESTGEISNAYIYYCEEAGANVDWSYYINKSLS